MVSAMPPNVHVERLLPVGLDEANGFVVNHRVLPAAIVVPGTAFGRLGSVTSMP